jgi:hypothetical protein
MLSPHRFASQLSSGSSSIECMSLWLLLALIVLIKLVVASLMLWLPFRSDLAMSALDDQRPADSDSESGEGDGGSKTLPVSPVEPHPRRPIPHRPRRGPHGSPTASSPARVRGPTRRVRARSLGQR